MKKAPVITVPKSAKRRAVRATPRSERARLADLQAQLQNLQADAPPAEAPTAAGTRAGFVTPQRALYQDLVVRVREAVRQDTPEHATVLMISKGDPELLKLEGQRAWHFPQCDDGTYAGAYPPDSSAAIAHLETLRIKGAHFLVIPEPFAWWLDYYSDFRLHLESHYPRVRRDDSCCIFDLRRQETHPHSRNGQARKASPAAAAPDETLVRIDLAHALRQRGQVSNARQVLEEGLEAADADLRIRLALLDLETHAGNLSAAEAHVAHLLALEPSHPETLFAAARLAWHQGQLAKTEGFLERLLDQHPHDPLALNEIVRLTCSRIEAQGPTANPALLDKLRLWLTDPAIAAILALDNRLRSIEALAGAGAATAALEGLQASARHLDIAAPETQEFLVRLLGPTVNGKAGIPFDDRRTCAAFLTHMGNGFAAAADAYRTQACYILARAADPESASAAAINLGFHAAARGDVLAAMHHFSQVRRAYADETARILWPFDRQHDWPHQKVSLAEGFAQLKPAGRAWPRITVISPSYNQAQYVEECVLSVLGQEYPDLEYIVVDGGSTDGSVDVLKRYQSQMTRLIVEPDRGQTHALNKALALATGDLIIWTNSDDMLAPGALFTLALTWLETNADIIAGFCFEHSDHRIGMINLPAATATTFNIECLGDMFGYWLKGHFFYQPEVAFSRRILERTQTTASGALDEKLHYTMDYEFWLRCAAASAKLAVVPWPVGLFRKHAQQKTASMDPTIIEQGQVRDRFMKPEPTMSRRLQIRRRISQALSIPRPRVHVISTRAAKIFSPETAHELHETLYAENLDVRFHDHLEGLRVGKHDLIVLLMHLFGEAPALRKLRDAGHEGPVLGWFWDNHHHVFDNVKAAVDLDVAIAGHSFAAGYLRSPRYIMAQPVPLCVTQWTAGEAQACFRQCGRQTRQDALYGGFVRYEFADKRNKLIDALRADGMAGVYFLAENDLSRYFGLSLADRFRQWASHKVSICLPLLGDLSQRFFDALLTGQIPIVPPDIHDLEAVIPPALMQELPVIRMQKYSVAAVRAAHAEALSLYDAQGPDGALRRHQWALAHHMFVNRIRQIVVSARETAMLGAP